MKLLIVEVIISFNLRIWAVVNYYPVHNKGKETKQKQLADQAPHR